MEKSNWVNYKVEIRERLKQFALGIVTLSEKLPKTTRANVVNYQVTKSGTSMYANYRAAMRARSRAEFFSKLSIVIEETDETEMWLDLVITSGILNKGEVTDLHKESLELLKILSHMRKNVSAR